MLNLTAAGHEHVGPGRAIVRRMRTSCLLLLLLAATSATTAAGQGVEKQLIVAIAGPELKGGIISEITWDGGAVLLQGVFAGPDGDLAAQYFVVPAGTATIERRDAHTDASLKYWEMKSNRVSPTGLGRISAGADTAMPQMGIGDLERRLADAHDMGGTQTRHVLRLGKRVILERMGTPPYDGETWSWSPLELNRLAYVDGKGDLWIARADGTSAKRLLRGDFTLPAWSTDGRSIAIAERKDGGRRWDISVVHLPAGLTR
jgi:hypothetical protein